MDYYVYILATKTRGVLYIGFTEDLVARVYAHRQELVPGFTQKYHIHKLVYFEVHEDRDEALKREKLIKRWKRDWKFELIEKDNARWEDLYNLIIQ